MRLTEAQRTLLNRAAIHSFEDGSGSGAPILDGFQARTADRLESNGLVKRTLPHSGHVFGFARITEAGRAALAGDQP